MSSSSFLNPSFLQDPSLIQVVIVVILLLAVVEVVVGVVRPSVHFLVLFLLLFLISEEEVDGIISFPSIFSKIYR